MPLCTTQVNICKFLCVRYSRARILLLFCIIGMLLLLHLTAFTLPLRNILSRSKSSWVFRSSEDTCSPQINIAFLKSHKCASSAIQNILFRYGFHHNLNFALPETGNYFGGGWLPFHGDLARATPWYMLGNNILTVHMKWNHTQVSSIMPIDTIFLTIVREPSEMFESLFTFTKMEKAYSKSLDEFVSTEEADMPRYRRFLGYNQMTWDFGLEEGQMNNLTAVREMVERADKEFDLVMVAERMDESLVLMSRLLCWKLNNVIVLKVNARMEKFKTTLSEASKKILRTKLASDYLLYDYFLRRFDQLVEAYGRERMEKDVSILQQATAKLLNKCHFQEEESANMQGANKPWSEMVSGYNAESSNKHCADYSRSEYSFINLLRGRQRMIAYSKYGARGSPGLDALPLGAEALQNTGDIMERVKTLQKMLVHKDPGDSVEGNITHSRDANSN